jgi:pyridoxal 5'-phosphate synthase pdxT subunit
VKVGVLGIQGDVREHARALDTAGATPVVVKTEADLDGVEGLILPGGESTTIGKLLDRYGLLEPIAQRARAGFPLFGTCAGVILMASEITGPDAAPHRLDVMDISVRRNAYGRQIDSFETAIDITGYDEPLDAVFIRAPVIERCGPDVEILATVDDDPVLVRQGRLLGATFHPEMTGEVRVHRMFLEVISDRLDDRARKSRPDVGA